MADPKEKNGFGDIDDWLADLDDEPKGEPAVTASAADLDSGGELDQSDIDQLLGGMGEEEPGPGEDQSSVELDQSDIDSLFNEEPSPAAEAKGEPELIAAAADVAAAGADDDFVGLDQSELDELLDDDKVESAVAAPVAAPEAAPEAAPDQAAPAAKAEGKDEYGFDGDDFDIDGFDFDDSIPDIPDIPDESILSAAQDKAPAKPADDGDIFADVPEAPAAAAEGQAATKEQRERKSFLAFLPPSLSSLPARVNRSTLGAGLFSLLLLIGGFYYFLGRQPAPEPAIPPLVREQMVQALEPEPAETMVPPVARDDRYRMEEQESAVAMQLVGRSADGGPLAYEIVTPPRYGRLSGEPPLVTYLPNKDFPGEDSFVYRVSDGLLVSEPARVEIVGLRAREEAVEPPVVLAEVEEVFELTPAYPWVRARDLSLATSSTEPLLIDWAEIWHRENGSPFSPRIKVEIMGADRLTGHLVAQGPSAHRYQPDPYFAGRESLRYRFNHAGVRSKPRLLTLEVTEGTPAPTLRLRPLAASYPVGETVLLDAGDTLAFRPQELRFEWEQLSGTTVLLEPLAANAAVVRFVAPSTFSTVAEPKVVLRVTAIDPQSGQRDSQIVEIATASRRHGALWSRGGGGSAGSGALYGL